MSKLTGNEIKKRIKTGEIIIDPFDESRLNPNSYNLSLCPQLLVYITNPMIGWGDPDDYDMYYHEVFEDKVRCLDNHRACRYHREHSRTTRYVPIELHPWFHVIDMKVNTPTYAITIPDDGLVLVPGRLYLGRTMEYTETHNLVPCLDGRSSIGRLGISIHATAGFGDVGFRGTWTLEISVVEPVRIYPNVPFCQISYETVVGEVTNYAGKYQDERDPQPSQIWKEFHEQR